MPVGVRLSHRSICRGNTGGCLSSISSSSATHCTLSQLYSCNLRCGAAVCVSWFACISAVSTPLQCNRALVPACTLSTPVHEWINPSGKLGECFFLSCTSFPSLIRTHSVNQAWIPNTITCKVLCLRVIGLARTAFLKRLAPLASIRPQPGASSKKRSWLEEDGAMRPGKEKRGKDKEGKSKRRGDYGLLASCLNSFQNYEVFIK